jgi:SAM-dependent methyltransferase
MNLPREYTSFIRTILDDWIPPIIRDTYWFMYPIAWVAFGKHASLFLNFRKKAAKLTEKEYGMIYETVNPLFTRPTDLTDGCVKKIERAVKGVKVLEVGAGRGYLARRLSKTHRMTVADIVVDDSLSSDMFIRTVSAPIEALPFANKSFDTVVCTHTLEHIIDFQKAVSELRRVMKKRLIIVVPKQRPFLYTLDLHVNYFPYPETLLVAMNPGNNHTICKEIDGDLFYIEDKL